jgi:uncharacterized repeat protein (TIGR01451 family)
LSGVTNTATITLNVPPTIQPYASGTYAANQQEIIFGFPAAMSIPIGGTLSITIPVVVGSAVPQLAPPNYYYNNSAVTYNLGSAASNAATVNVSLLANLSVSKTDGVTTTVPGATVNYTVTFVNGGPSAANGAVAKDVPSAGLGSCTVQSCAATGGAPASTCPGTISDLLITAGTAIPTFSANSTVTFVVRCSVTATGS